MAKPCHKNYRTIFWLNTIHFNFPKQRVYQLSTMILHDVLMLYNNIHMYVCMYAHICMYIVITVNLYIYSYAYVLPLKLWRHNTWKWPKGNLNRNSMYLQKHLVNSHLLTYTPPHKLIHKYRYTYTAYSRIYICIGSLN